MSIERHQGGCHCGAVSFEVNTDIASALRCNCSLCKRKGAVMLAGEEGSFKLLSGSESVSLYQFNTQVAEHYFCKHCGIYTHHSPRSNPSICRVNAGCIDAINIDSLSVGLNDGASFS